MISTIMLIKLFNQLIEYLGLRVDEWSIIDLVLLLSCSNDSVWICEAWDTEDLVVKEHTCEK